MNEIWEELFFLQSSIHKIPKENKKIFFTVFSSISHKSILHVSSFFYFYFLRVL